MSPLQVTLWDTGGMERRSRLTTSYYRPAVGVIFVYDTANLETLNKLASWIKHADDYCKEQHVYALWGNNCDTYKNPVEACNVKGFTSRHQSVELCAEVNAITGENVSESFQELIETVHSKLSSLGDAMGTSLGRPASTVNLGDTCPGNIQEASTRSHSSCFSIKC